MNSKPLTINGETVADISYDQMALIYYALINQDKDFIARLASVAVEDSAQVIAQLTEDAINAEIPDTSDVKNHTCGFVSDMLSDFSDAFSEYVNEADFEVHFSVKRTIEAKVSFS